MHLVLELIADNLQHSTPNYWVNNKEEAEEGEEKVKEKRVEMDDEEG